MKIVSLLPSATELVWELGLDHRLVAVSHECDVPATIAGLPRATGSGIPPGLNQRAIDQAVSQAVAAGRPLYRVDGALVAGLRPDLILTQGLCEVCAVTPETLQASLRGVRCVLPRDTILLSFDGVRKDEIMEDFRRLAERVGLAERAEERLRRFTASWSRFAPPPVRARVLLIEWTDPLYAAGHWVPEQIEAAGLVSAIGRPGEPARRVSWAEVAAAAPDAIGIISCGCGLAENIEGAQQLLARPEMATWFTGPVVAFDANRCFSRPTLRIADGVEQLHRAFVLGEANGSAFSRVRD